MLDNLPSQIFNWEKLEFKEHKYIMVLISVQITMLTHIL
jgi:hypothetical protein